MRRPDDGGRWTSCALAGREWLWPGRVWWTDRGRGMRRSRMRAGWTSASRRCEARPITVGCGTSCGSRTDELGRRPVGDAQLHRRSTAGRPSTSAKPAPLGRLPPDAPPGYRFIWAAHALLDCAVGATISAGTERMPPISRGCSTARHLAGRRPLGLPRAGQFSVWTPTDQPTVLRSARCWSIARPPRCAIAGPELDHSTSVAPGNLSPRPSGATSAASRPKRRTGASASNRCSAASSTWPKPGPATRPSYRRVGELAWRLIVSARPV